MLIRPTLSPSLEPVVDPDDGLFLFREGELVAWLREPIFAPLAALLAEGRELSDLYRCLGGSFEGPEIMGALEHLRERRFLSLTTSNGSTAELAFWERATGDGSGALGRLASVTLALRSFGSVATTDFAELATEVGFQVAPEGDAYVVLADDYLHPDLEAWNRGRLDDGKPWVLARPVGTVVWIGPLFRPGQTACWECLAHRLRGHRRVARYLEGREAVRLRTPPWPAVASSVRTVSSVLVTQVALALLSEDDSVLSEGVITEDTLTMRRGFHPLARRPQCSACGAPGLESDPRPLRLRSRPKVNGSDGGHRATDQETVERVLDRLVSPVTGIVTSLRAAPGEYVDEDGVIVTYEADHNFAEMHDRQYFLKEGLRRRSGGKGQNPRQARLGAIAESIERYCGVHQGSERRCRAAYEDVAERAIRPDEHLGFSARQYDERATWNASGLRSRYVPLPFRTDVEVDWTPVHSLTTGREALVVTSHCYFGYESADPEFARADSNGCAAGSVLEEAILQGTLELVERDAVAIWWYNRLPRPGVHLESARDAYGVRLREAYRSFNRDLWALDLTHDLGIPTFAALSRRVDEGPDDIIFGFGSHLDPSVALNRALTEMNQSLLSVPSPRGGNGAGYRGDADARRWWQEVTVDRAPYLAPARTHSPLDVGESPVLASDDLRDDVTLCVERLRERDIELFVLDQTRPDIDFPVVRVIAPGLRHFWARLGPGRLYDVPLAAGHIEEPRKESELNRHVVHF